MTKESLAKQINYKCNIGRTITSINKMQLVEGQKYNNRGKTESWQDMDSSSSSFIPEVEGEYIYYFNCSNVPVHKVDYENEEEVEILNAYENEAEVLVPSNAIMEITFVSTDDDYKEMGYYTVDLVFKGFEGENI